MGHHCCSKQKVKRGLWSPEEDEKLVRYITTHDHGCWSSVPKHAGLQRCGKSCRLRWINYLRPDLKRGSFSSHEERIIIDVHRILGNRWAQIAKHLPGRTDNEVKNFWNSCIKKKLMAQGLDPKTHNLVPASRPPNSISSSNLSQFHHHPQTSTTPFTISSSIKGFENSKNSSMDMNPPFLTLPHPQPNLQLHERTMHIPSFHCQDPNALMTFQDQTSMDFGDHSNSSLDHANVASSFIQQEFMDDTSMWASSMDPMETLKQDGVLEAQQEQGHEQAQQMCRLNFGGEANEEKTLDMETSYHNAAFDLELMETELMPCGMFGNGNPMEPLPWDC